MGGSGSDARPVKAKGARGGKPEPIVWRVVSGDRDLCGLPENVLHVTPSALGTGHLRIGLPRIGNASAQDRDRVITASVLGQGGGFRATSRHGSV